jgi:hypothetical protein
MWSVAHNLSCYFRGECKSRSEISTHTSYFMHRKNEMRGEAEAARLQAVKSGSNYHWPDVLFSPTSDIHGTASTSPEKGVLCSIFLVPLCRLDIAIMAGQYQ